MAIVIYGAYCPLPRFLVWQRTSFSESQPGAVSAVDCWYLGPVSVTSLTHDRLIYAVNSAAARMAPRNCARVSW
jgi:hypothetical protein